MILASLVIVCAAFVGAGLVFAGLVILHNTLNPWS